MILNGLSQQEDVEIYSHLDVWGCTDRNAISINGNYVHESLCSVRICPFVCKYNDWLILALGTAEAFLPLMGGTQGGLEHNSDHHFPQTCNSSTLKFLFVRRAEDACQSWNCLWSILVIYTTSFSAFCHLLRWLQYRIYVLS